MAACLSACFNGKPAPVLWIEEATAPRPHGHDVSDLTGDDPESMRRLLERMRATHPVLLGDVRALDSRTLAPATAAGDSYVESWLWAERMDRRFPGWRSSEPTSTPTPGR